MVCVFARETSEPLTSLVKQIDRKVAENSKLKGFVVLMTGEGDRAAGKLKAMAEEAGVEHVPLTLYQEPAGPPDYEIAKDADITVVMWKGHKVRVNRAFKGEPTAEEIRSVVADVSKVLDH